MSVIEDKIVTLAGQTSGRPARLLVLRLSYAVSAFPLVLIIIISVHIHTNEDSFPFLDKILY